MKKIIDLPFGWANWKAAEVHPGFLFWATQARNGARYGARYAVVDGRAWGGWSGYRWVRVSPNPDVPLEVCGGAFYDDAPDHPEGGQEWARRSARARKARDLRLIRRGKLDRAR